MKNILALLLLAGAGLATSAQEAAPTPKPADSPAAAVETKEPVSKIEEPLSPCDLGIQHSPIVDGTMQLGMSEKEAALKLSAPFESDPSGPATQKRASTKLDKNPIFEKVESGSLTSVGDRVTSIRLVYPTKYANVKEFIQKAAPRLGLVRIGFRVDNASNEARMVCKEFTVDLKTTQTGSEILLTSTAGSRTN